MGGDGGGFVVVVAAGVEVAIEAGEVGSGDLDADAVAGGEEVGGDHGGEGDLVDFAVLHPDGFVVAVTVAEALDGLIEVVGGAVGENVDDLDGDVGVLDVRGDEEGGGDRAGDLGVFGEGLGGVDEDVGAFFHLALIEGSAVAGDGIGGAADVAAVGGGGVEGVVGEGVGEVDGGGFAGAVGFPGQSSGYSACGEG